jgi:hypothetical protein
MVPALLAGWKLLLERWSRMMCMTGEFPALLRALYTANMVPALLAGSTLSSWLSTSHDKL